MSKIVSILCALALLHSSASAQDTTHVSTNAHLKPVLFSERDLARVGVAAVGVGVISLADESVARAFQRSWLHDKPGLQHSANFIQAAGDPGALVTSLSLYLVGSVAHQPGLADAGMHSTEALAVSAAFTQLLKFGIGRARPNLTHDANAYAFHLAHGNETDFNSFPSGHVTAAFAAAAVFSAEIRRTHPDASGVATPLLYGVATLVGASRMYNDRHWLSDVVAGALIGHFVGRRIVAHAHGVR